MTIRERAQDHAKEALTPLRGRGALSLDEVARLLEAAFVAGNNSQLERKLEDIEGQLDVARAERRKIEQSPPSHSWRY